MQPFHSPPSPHQHLRPPPSENMEDDTTNITLDDPSSIWDLSYLLDDQIPFPVDLAAATSSQQQQPLSPPFDLDSPVPPQSQDILPPPPPVSVNDRVRKRDPRLTCSNFLAGRVPCACPEIDAKLEEEGLPGKKRVRTAARGSPARCQVPGCEVDISELKGYHKRHRVCLRCANATTVMLNGEAKRYCQQCGKFHVLSDFDEGKRSCRRKLERHNNRRRRKPSDSRAPADHEPEPEPETVTQNEDSYNDGEAGKDCSNVSSEMNEKEVSLDHEDEPIAILSTAPEMQNITNGNVISFVASGETQVNSGKDVSNVSNSPSYCDNKSAYSSLCQTGRISFKLYDWNPAEFPRRLRHQIFQWLASMPLELEGYIRPGCTILTIFIAMPNNMWINLLEDPIHYVRDLVAPRKMLSGRGTALVRLNNMIFHVIKDGTSVTKVEVNVQAPSLQYVHPTYFEAGKPMEFVACGSNFLQRKFRLLVSFSGKYLKCEYCVPTPHNWTGDNISCAFDNQLYKIYVPHTEESHFGPAFIEVENESGVSNFIPVLIGDKEICSEMKALQQKLDAYPLSRQFQSSSGDSICSSCEAFAHRHMSSSDLLVDIAWLLKDPTSEHFDRVMSTSQIQRYCYLLDFLISYDSTIILEKVLPNLVILTESMKSNVVVNVASDVDLTQLRNHIHGARHIIYQKRQINLPSVAEMKSQDILSRADLKLGILRSSTSNDKSDRIPLLKRDIIMNVEEFPKRSCGRYLGRGFFSSRPTIFMFVSVAVCLGVCVAFIHHGKVSELAVTIRRCLFNYS